MLKANDDFTLISGEFEEYSLECLMGYLLLVFCRSFVCNVNCTSVFGCFFVVKFKMAGIRFRPLEGVADTK